MPGTLGQNGLALYALFKAGVPADTGRLSHVVEDLVDHLHTFGLPDDTWDLSWLAAGLSVVPEPGDLLVEIRGRIANKLLLGQIADEPGKGLWGPYCVNPGLVASMMGIERDLNQKLQILRQELRSNPEHRGKLQQLETLTREREGFVRHYLHLDQSLHLQQHDIFRNHSVNFGEIPNDPEKSISVRVMPVIGFGEQLGDLASTRTALFGLWCLDRVGDMPARTGMPVDLSGRPLLPPRQTATVLQDARHAVLAARNAQGSLTEANLYRTHAAFDRMGILGIPIPRENQPVLDSAVTFDSLSDGYAALTLLQGFPNFPAPPMPLGSLAAQIQSRISEIIPQNPRPQAEAVMRAFSSMVTFSGIGFSDDDTRRTFLAYLLKIQNPEEGYWGMKLRNRISLPPLVLEQFFTRTEDRWQASMRIQSPAAMEAMTEELRAQRSRQVLSIFSRQMEYPVFCTATALIFLRDAASQPAAAFWPPGPEGQPGHQMLFRVLDQIRRTHRAASNLQSLGVEEDFSNLSPDLPMLLMTGLETKNLPPAATRNLTAYLRAGGLLLAAAPANPEGKGFLGGVRDLVQDGLPNSGTQTLPLGASGVRLEAVLRADGSLAALFLPIGAETERSPDTLPGSHAALVLLYEVMQARLGPERLQGLGSLDGALLQDQLFSDQP